MATNHSVPVNYFHSFSKPSAFFKNFLIFYFCLWGYIELFNNVKNAGLIILILTAMVGQLFFSKRNLYFILTLSPFIGILTHDFYGATLKPIDIYLIVFSLLHILFLFRYYLNYTGDYLLPFYIFGSIIIINMIYVQINAANIILEYGQTIEGFSLQNLGVKNLKNFTWLQLYITLIIIMIHTIRNTENLERYLSYYLLIQTMIGCWSLLGILKYYITGVPDVAMWRQGESFFRLRGADWEPSYYGTYLLIILPLFLLPFLKKVFLYNKSFHLFAMIVFFLNLILSLSSSAWLLLPFVLIINFGFILYFIREKGMSIPLILTSVMIIFSVSLGLAFLMNQTNVIEGIFNKVINPMQDGSGQNRVNNMVVALQVFWRNPIFGSGYFESGNAYTEMLALYGILGIIIFLVIMGFLFRRALCYRKFINDQRLNIYSVSLGCSILCILITMLINSTFFRIHYWIIFGFILARYQIAKGIIFEKIRVFTH